MFGRRLVVMCYRAGCPHFTCFVLSFMFIYFILYLFSFECKSSIINSLLILNKLSSITYTSIVNIMINISILLPLLCKGTPSRAGAGQPSYAIHDGGKSVHWSVCDCNYANWQGIPFNSNSQWQKFFDNSLGLDAISLLVKFYIPLAHINWVIKLLKFKSTQI